MDNREKILACALQLFSAHGYDAVGVQEVADAAGVRKPTLYHYFGSKHGLLEALLAQYYRPLNEQVRQAAAYTGDLPLTLRGVARTFFHFANQHPTYYHLQLALWFAPLDSEPHRLVESWNLQQYQIIETLFTLAAQDHGNMKSRQRFYATSFVGLLNTYIGLALNSHAVLDEALVERTVHQFEHGIYS